MMAEEFDVKIVMQLLNRVKQCNHFLLTTYDTDDNVDKFFTDVLGVGESTHVRTKHDLLKFIARNQSQAIERLSRMFKQYDSSEWVYNPFKDQ